MSSLTYKDAGVDIDAGSALVEAIKPMAKATTRRGVAGGLGGFGALFDLKAAGYDDPVLVACTDGVGTKLKIAFDAGRHDTVGVDLVAMSVNDLVVQGAEPLFFLDYFATGRLAVDDATAVIKGIAQGCQEAGCALIGGETAEMPGLYAPGEYDLAGFALGAAERGQLLTNEHIAEGDVILGLASNGLHSNGFSLARKVVDHAKLAYDAPAPFAADSSLADALLAPTRIYVKSCLAAHRAGLVKGLAHITGGGLVENLPRILPDGLGARLDGKSWSIPPVFGWLAAAGGIAPAEMARTFNCGIGMCVVVGADNVATTRSLLAEQGETVTVIGQVTRSPAPDRRVAIDGWEAAWRG